MKELKKYIAGLIGIVIMIGLFFVPVSKNNPKTEGELYAAEIIDLTDRKTEDSGGYQTVMIKYVAQITDERYKDLKVEAEDIYEQGTPHIEARAGDEVLLHLEKNESDDSIIRAYIAGFKRDKLLIALAIIFALLVIVIGRIKGLQAMISLVFTVLLVLKILLPRILAGDSPIFLSLFIATLITIGTLLIISGFTRKTASAIIGTVSGVFFAGLLAYSFSYFSKLIGFSYEEIQMLTYIPQNTKFDFNGLLFAAILLGALGAVMDVSMSISSALYEIKQVNPSLTGKNLFKSGMNIGRDIMGTMVNTLILAYTGSSLNLLILLLAYNKPFIEILNYDMIVVEIVRALSGTIGLILTIPITALAATLLFNQQSESSSS